jgi:hypothetical protein
MKFLKKEKIDGARKFILFQTGSEVVGEPGAGIVISKVDGLKYSCYHPMRHLEDAGVPGFYHLHIYLAFWRLELTFEGTLNDRRK